jgi:selenocysteine-specific elongation factor
MRLSAPLFTAVLAEMARQQSIVTANGVARLPQHASRLTAEQAALWHRLEPRFWGEARFRPPRLTELEGRVAGAGELRTMMKHAAKLGLVEEVAPDHFFLRGAVAEAAAIVGVLAEAAADGQFGAADLRDRLDTGRKNAIELLEFFDRHGVTIRRGDRRRIDAAKLARFAPSRTP